MIRTGILLVHCQQIFRGGLRELINSEPDFSVVGEASDGKAAIEKVAEFRPDIVLMEIGGEPNMDDCNFRAARQIKKLRSDTKVLFLAMRDEGGYAVQCVSAGGNGCVSMKGATTELLLTALRDVYQGGSYMSPVMLSQLVDRLRPPAYREVRPATLTPREQEILGFLAEGRRDAEIASDLNLSPGTVKGYRFRLAHKLGIRGGGVGLSYYAITHNIVSSGVPAS